MHASWVVLQGVYPRSHLTGYCMYFSPSLLSIPRLRITHLQVSPLDEDFSQIPTPVRRVFPCCKMSVKNEDTDATRDSPRR